MFIRRGYCMLMDYVTCCMFCRAQLRRALVHLLSCLHGFLRNRNFNCIKNVKKIYHSIVCTMQEPSHTCTIAQVYGIQFIMVLIKIQRQRHVYKVYLAVILILDWYVKGRFFVTVVDVDDHCYQTLSYTPHLPL